ncbi:unnamed protein product [Gulo gulo]|uniref:Uncharacterized protein n=1 Tax=Gulo gulo TaxID=48420 RepID=A0A9X9LYX2_GULGU|nr:unnamed protein product [Gulo gulo]
MQSRQQQQLQQRQNKKPGPRLLCYPSQIAEHQLPSQALKPETHQFKLDTNGNLNFQIKDRLSNVPKVLVIHNFPHFLLL